MMENHTDLELRSTGGTRAGSAARESTVEIQILGNTERQLIKLVEDGDTEEVEKFLQASPFIWFH